MKAGAGDTGGGDTTQLPPAPNQGRSPSEVERGKREQDRGITLSSGYLLPHARGAAHCWGGGSQPARHSPPPQNPPGGQGSQPHTLPRAPARIALELMPRGAGRWDSAPFYLPDFRGGSQSRAARASPGGVARAALGGPGEWCVL